MSPDGPEEDAECPVALLRHLLRLHPAPTLRILRNVAGVHHHTLLRVLDRLEEEREVVRWRFRGRIHVLPGQAEWWKQWVVLREERSRQIHRWVGENGPCRQCDVARHFRSAGLPLSTVQSRLRDLEDVRLVARFKRDAQARWMWYRAISLHPRVRDLFEDAGTFD